MTSYRIPCSTCCFAITLLVTAMIGCTQSETPLSSREEGFADLYLLGEWRGYEPDGEGGFRAGALTYDVSLTDDGDLRVVQFDDDESIDRVLSAFSTRLDGRKYVNARVIECPGCNADELARLATDRCPYQIVQYSTFLPRSLASGDLDEDDRELLEILNKQATTLRGQLLFMALMDSKYIKDVISNDVIAGTADCETCVSDGPCVAARGEDLQLFLRESDRDIYASESWTVMIRTSTE